MPSVPAACLRFQNHQRIRSTIGEWTTIPSRPSTLRGSGLDVLGSLYLAYDLLGGRHGPLRLLTRAVTYSVVFGSATASALVSSLAWLPVLPPASICRLNSIEQLAGSIITPCLGKDCLHPSAGSRSELDCTGFWASDSQSRSPFSSRSAKYSLTLRACVLPVITQPLGVHGLPVGGFGELWPARSASSQRPLFAALSSVTLTTLGRLRFALGS